MPNVRNLGSGEGVVGQYRHAGHQEDPAGRNESVMFYADEVDCVAALAKRDGSNLMSIVRMGFSGGTLGFSYTHGRDVHIPASEYRMTLVLSVQPERSGWLFDDEAGGTPQRLMWFPGDDPRISDAIPERIGATALTMPKATEFQLPAHAGHPRRGATADPLGAGGAGRGERAALDGHALFAREKFAFGLAVLDGRAEMTSEDWRRAGIAAEVSSYVRDWTQAVEKASGVARATEEGALRGVAQEAADDERAIRRVLRWALRTLDGDQARDEVPGAATEADRPGPPMAQTGAGTLVRARGWLRARPTGYGSCHDRASKLGRCRPFCRPWPTSTGKNSSKVSTSD